MATGREPTSATTHAATGWLRTLRGVASSHRVEMRPSEIRARCRHGWLVAAHSSAWRLARPIARVSAGSSSRRRASGRRESASQSSAPRLPKVTNCGPSSPTAWVNAAGGRIGVTAAPRPQWITSA